MGCKEVKGKASIWFGSFERIEQFEEYISEVHCASENIMEEVLQHYPGHPLKNILTKDDFKEALKKVFLETNKDRPFEEKLKKYYNQAYNQFGYDYGILFIDEDLVEKSFCFELTNSIDKLLKEWEEEFVSKVKLMLGNVLDKSYNAVFVMLDSKYGGAVKSVKHDEFELDYMGYIEYSL